MGPDQCPLLISFTIVYRKTKTPKKKTLCADKGLHNRRNMWQHSQTITAHTKPLPRIAQWQLMAISAHPQRQLPQVDFWSSSSNRKQKSTHHHTFLQPKYHHSGLPLKREIMYYTLEKDDLCTKDRSRPPYVQHLIWTKTPLRPSKISKMSKGYHN